MRWVVWGLIQPLTEFVYILSMGIIYYEAVTIKCALAHSTTAKQACQGEAYLGTGQNFAKI